MKPAFAMLVVGICLTALAALWLGWGRSPQSWKDATGWNTLDAQTRASARAVEVQSASEGSMPKLDWWGHATMQLEWDGLRLLFDPIAESRITVSPRRFGDRAPIPETLMTDAIFLTHAHMDHFNNATLERLPASTIYLPAGSERFLSPAVRERHRVHPLPLNETVDLGNVLVTTVPARHGGWRYPWQQGLFACGYLIRKDDRCVYLAGDTAYGDHFEAIARAHHPDWAILPIGAYAPRWFLKSRHINPEEAVRAATVLGVKKVIPYHFGTYRVSLESMQAPLVRFARAAGKQGISWWLPAPDDS